MYKSLKRFIWSILSEKGELSSKRTIAITGMLTLIYLMVYTQHAGKAIDHHVFDGMIVVVLGAAGITAGEKIFNRFSGKNDEEKGDDKDA